jgi:hypothetical protein
MSRFTVTILLATMLLGMLLWIVLSTVAQFANPPRAIPAPDSTPGVVLDPKLPRIRSIADLATNLSASAHDADVLLANLVSWRSERGYPDTAGLLGEILPATHPYTDLDDAGLVAIAGRGDVTAMQLLAERSLSSNPVEALEWYDHAIINGSVFAMLRVADLLTTLGDPALIDFNSDPIWQQALAEINAGPLSPKVRALAWSIAAIHVGGYAVLDAHLAQRITALKSSLDDASADIGCETAQQYVLEAATARRARGGAVFSMNAPTYALSIAEPENFLRCNVPVVPLVQLQNCAIELFVGPGDALWQQWICTPN